MRDVRVRRRHRVRKPSEGILNSMYRIGPKLKKIEMSGESTSVSLLTTQLPSRELTLGLGTIVTDNYGPKNPEGFAALLENAAAAGIGTVDTAGAYGCGESERLLGRWMEELDLSFKICTKIGIDLREAETDGGTRYVLNASSDALWRQAEKSLSHLKCNQVEYLLLHRPDPKVPVEQTMETLAAIRDAGLAKKIGFSNVREAEAMSLLKEGIADIIQYPWSLLDSRATTILEAGGRAHVERMVFGTLAFGILAGSVKLDTIFEHGDWRGAARSGRDPGTNGAKLFMGDEFVRAAVRGEEFEKSAQSIGLSLAAATVAASLSVAPAEQVIVGCRTAEELLGLVEGVGIRLPEDLLAQAREMTVI